MKDGDGYVLTSAIVAVTPDVGHIVDGLTRIREPDPSKSVVHLLGGHKLMLNKSASEVIAAIEAESRPVEDPAFLEVQDTPDEAAQLLDWLGQRTDLDLAYKYDLEPGWIPKHLMKPGPIPKEGWCVHQESGGRSDRQWMMISLEATPLEALRSAHKAFCDGR